MNTWLAAGKLYVREMDLEDIAALKLCLMSLGILMGLGIPLRGRKPAALLAAFLFVGTYIPLVSKFICLLTHPKEGV